MARRNPASGAAPSAWIASSTLQTASFYGPAEIFLVDVHANRQKVAKRCDDTATEKTNQQ